MSTGSLGQAVPNTVRDEHEKVVVDAVYSHLFRDALRNAKNPNPDEEKAMRKHAEHLVDTAVEASQKNHRTFLESTMRMQQQGTSAETITEEQRSHRSALAANFRKIMGYDPDGDVELAGKITAIADNIVDKKILKL